MTYRNLQRPAHDDVFSKQMISSKTVFSSSLQLLIAKIPLIPAPIIATRYFLDDKFNEFKLFIV